MPRVPSTGSFLPQAQTLSRGRSWPGFSSDLSATARDRAAVTCSSSSGHADRCKVFLGSFRRLGESATAACVYGYRRSTRISSRTGECAATIHDAERTLALLRQRIGNDVDVRPVLAFSAQEGLQVAQDEDADLIVVGSTARGRWGRTLPGATADRLLNRAPCVVAVVPLGTAIRPRTRCAVSARRTDEATRRRGDGGATSCPCHRQGLRRGARRIRRVRSRRSPFRRGCSQEPGRSQRRTLAEP
jgi:nucleotide-binding universal stress UspA family protein